MNVEQLTTNYHRIGGKLCTFQIQPTNFGFLAKVEILHPFGFQGQHLLLVFGTTGVTHHGLDAVELNDANPAVEDVLEPLPLDLLFAVPPISGDHSRFQGLLKSLRLLLVLGAVGVSVGCL